VFKLNQSATSKGYQGENHAHPFLPHRVYFSFMYTLGELWTATSNRKTAAYPKCKPFTACFSLSTDENSDHFSDGSGDTRIACGCCG
jgi:hypothetical protein